MLSCLKILLVGCGSMGSAMLQGWIKADVSERRYTVITPHRESIIPFTDKAEITWAKNPSELPADYQPDIVVLAVKPQIMGDILRYYYEYALNGAIFVTIAAGKEIASFRHYLGEHATIIRVMPNLPAAYGKGMSVGYAEESAPDQHIKLVNALFSSLGQMNWVSSENLFHPVTAVSGSGPAYIFLLVEALSLAAKVSGIEPEQADTLARQTVIGAASLLEHSHESASLLKGRVTSPGGVTEAALKILEAEDSGLREIILQAIVQGTLRSRELADG